MVVIFALDYGWLSVGADMRLFGGWRWGVGVAIACESLLIGVADASATAFSPAPGSPLWAAGGAGQVAFDPSGGLLAAGTRMFSVGSTGALTPLGLAPDPYAGAEAFSPNGEILAAADQYGPTAAGGDTVSTFTVSSSGALTAVAGSPFTVGSRPTSLAFSPTGNLLAVIAGNNADQLYMFTVSASGALTAVAGSPFSVSSGSVAWSPTGNLLGISGSEGVSMYTVSGAGAVSEVSGSPFDAFGSAPSDAAFSPNGSLLAVSNFSGGVTMYSVEPTGVLTAIGTGPFGSTDSNSVAFSPDGGSVVATVNDWEGLDAYSVGSTGALSTPTLYQTSAPSLNVAFGPTGQLATADISGDITTLVPGSTSSSTAWPGAFGSDGYDLAAFDNGSDTISMPEATVDLVQGSRTVWSTKTTDPRALESPDGSYRTAAAYTDPNQVEIDLTFSKAYSGDLRLYAVDWNSGSDFETITVSDGATTLGSTVFAKQFGALAGGEWALLPVDVTAGQTITITATNQDGSIAGTDAVLSGIFLN